MAAKSAAATIEANLLIAALGLLLGRYGVPFALGRTDPQLELGQVLNSVREWGTSHWRSCGIIDTDAARQTMPVDGMIIEYCCQEYNSSSWPPRLPVPSCPREVLDG